MNIKKLITLILIYCLIIQIPFFNEGCMSYFPIEGDKTLLNHKIYNNDILIKLKDSTDVEVPQGRIYHLEKDKIDSAKVAEYESSHYQIFWMHDKKKITFKIGNERDMQPDSSNDFWIVWDKNEETFIRINNSDIQEIQTHKVDGTKTSLLLVGILGVCAILGFIFAKKDTAYISIFPHYKGYTYQRGFNMLKKLIASILIPAFLMQVFGCYSEHLIDKENLQNYRADKIRIVTDDGKDYTCNPNFWTTKNDTLFFTRNDSTKNDTIRGTVYIPKTIFAGIGFALVSFVIIVIITKLTEKKTGS